MKDSLDLPPRLAAIAASLPRDLLAFRPVPVRARRDGWTAKHQRGFILRLALTGCPGTSARAVGRTRESAYRLRARKGATSFAAAWDLALGCGRSQAGDLAIERGLLGEVRPVFYRGRRCGEYLRHDNRLILAVINRLTPPPAPAAEEPDFETLLNALR